MPNPQHELQRARAVLGSGDPKGAARICQKLLLDNPRDLEARYLQGRCLAGLGRLRDATSDFRRVLSMRGDFFPAMVDLGIAETLDGNFQAAQTVLERARAMDPRPAELHFGLGLCYLGFKDNAAAVAAFRAAVERNPRFPDAYNNMGVAFDRLGDLASAAVCFRQAVAIHPGYAEAHRNLGDVLSRTGDPSGAVLAHRRAADLQPDDAAVRAELGAAQLADGNLPAAAESLERALRLDSRLGRVAAQLGDAHRLLARMDLSEAAYRHALLMEPRLGAAHLGLARLALARGDHASAVLSLVDAADADPNDVATVLMAAAELEALGSTAQALTALRRTADLAAGLADSHDALGALLHRLGRLPEALDCYERALDIDDQRARIHLHCGQALESMGALSRAIECFERARTLEPANAEAVASIASCAFRLCDWDLKDAMLSRLRELPNGIDALQAFLLLASDFDPADVAESLARRARATTWPTAPAHLGPSNDPAGDRLRVAYVSPDFKVHPVAYAIAGVIGHHDRSRIVAIGVSLVPSDGSPIRTRLEGAFDEFHDVSALGDRDIVALMRERRIDIAVDLAGLTTGSRPAIFAMRAAPAQVNYLGFPGSMGAGFMDYIIADPVVLPESDNSLYAEKVLRLPDAYLPFDDSRTIGDSATRENAGLPIHSFVFCAFNNGYKITRPVFEIWMRLLQDVPSSVLWLRSMGPTTADKLRNAAVACGVATERLIFATFEENREAHLARLPLADLFLDTQPYNAHTTAAEALWAGVPVVTCIGKTFAGRVGASLLAACGLPDLICADLEAYRTLALRIALSSELQTELRARLKARKPTSPCFDTRRYTRGLEDLFTSIGPGAPAM